MEGAAASATSRAPALVAAATVLLLLALVGWWHAVDGQPPDFDSGKHLLHAWAYTDSFEAGDLTAPLTEFTQYPPLAHVVGALGALVGGVEVASTVLAAAFVFLPLLGLGMYRAGRIVGGPWTGALAMVFVAGAPLLLTSARAFLLETYVTALLACAVWLLLESRRFERPWPALAAGVAVSLGLLVKQPFAFFVAGVPLVMLMRGGWRRPLGLAAFAAPVLVLGAPWYIGHWDELRSTAEWVTGVNSEGPLLGAKNLSYYGWSVLNRGLMLPLALIGALGVVGAAVRFARRPEPSSSTPELLAGLVTGWAGITFYVHLKAPYYALPLLVYVGLLERRLDHGPQVRAVAAGGGLGGGRDRGSEPRDRGIPPGRARASGAAGSQRLARRGGQPSRDPRVARGVAREPAARGRK